MAEVITIAEARERTGLRIASLAGVPTPWAEAARGIFHAKGISYALAHRGPDEPADAIAQWAGDASVPVVAWEQERLRTGWAEILILAERLQPQPPLVPWGSAARMELFGLGHEICGEMGFGWAYRLLMIQRSLGHGGEGGAFPTDVAGYLAGRYGFLPQHVQEAKGRVLGILGHLDDRLARQGWLVGDGLTAADIWWAVFANLVTPLPEAELPAAPVIRDAYTCRDNEILDAVTDRLRAHQRRIYDEVLELPVQL